MSRCMCTAMINQAHPCDNCLYPCTSGTYEENNLFCMYSKVKLLIYIVKPLFYLVNETAQYDKTDRLGRSLCIQGADRGFQVSWNWFISVSQLFHLPEVEIILKKWLNEMNTTKTHVQKKNAMQCKHLASYWMLAHVVVVGLYSFWNLPSYLFECTSLHLDWQ